MVGLFIAIALISVCVIAVLAARFGVVDLGEKIKVYKPCADESVVPYKKKTLILLTIFCFAITLAAQISLYHYTNTVVSFVKLYGVLLLVLCAGAIDFKRRIIPNALILIGLAFRAGIYVYEFLCVDNIQAVLISDGIGFAIGFVFLALVSAVTKGSLGFGDVKLFGVIGLTTGAVCTYSTLLISLVLSVIVSVIGIATKKMGRKDSFPFGPCIAAGYAIAVLLTSY